MRRAETGTFPRTLKLAATTVILLTVVAVTHAFINPNFTPIHLKEQSDLILVLKFDAAVKDGKGTATVTKALKGEAPAKPLTFDFLAGAAKAHGEDVCRMITDGTRDAMLFVGFFEVGEEGGMDMGGEEGARGMLHIGTKWIVLTSVEKDLWDMVKPDSHMQGTWAGSTDMLLRAMTYIFSDPDADVPVCTGAEWRKHVMIAKIDGKVHDVKPVAPDGSGKLCLLVTCESGDRLLEYQDGKFADVTARHKLSTKSRVTLWTDGGLVSWDGSILRLAGAPLTKPGALGNGCVSLSMVHPGKHCGILIIGTSASPEALRLTPGAAGVPGKLVKGDFPGKELGAAGKCLVADFDGDDVPDIIQPFERGGLFYKGTTFGEFAAPARIRIGLGKGRSAAAVGDYDADGLLDIFTTAEDGNRIWHNLGNAHFAETLWLSGEIPYISKSGGVSTMTGDVNNDGRQDILIGYSGMLPQIFFNRGFRSFGHSHQLDLGELRLLPQAGDGQQAVCLGDFDGNGAQDMVLVLENGEVWYFPRQALNGQALTAVVSLPAGKGFAEPVMVTGWSGKRCLGVWPVTTGGPPAFFGLLEAGPVTLKWRFPGGEPQTKEVLVVDRPVRFTPTPTK